jgi:20S proteasome alpha/beta subunit
MVRMKVILVPLETLVLHGLKALSTGVGNDEEISEKNIEVATVGEEGFKLLGAAEIKTYLEKLKNFNVAPGAMQAE